MARQRPALAVDLRAALARHETAAHEEREAWAAALLELANVNAGPAALLAAFRATSATYPKAGALRRLAVSIAAATDVCRAAGASAARLSLEARAQLADRLERGAWGPEAAWWRGLLQLARDDGALIATAVASSAEVLAVCGTEGFDIFVTTALRASRDRLRRASFLSLADPEARRVLDRLAGRSTFSASQRALAAYACALWGEQPILRAAAGAESAPAPRRTTFAHGIVLVPETFADVPPHLLPDLFRAAVAHIGAHGAYGSPLREPGKLKPAQITLVGLIEDARVEALAMRRFPGLRQLWAPFHTTRPSILRTAPELFARLAHALFDPAHEDGDSFITKARDLFAAEPDLADSELSRRIGGLLGNDIGQMRIPFNPKTFVIEPVYRDDNLGFWILPPADHTAEDLETTIEALRRTSKSADDPDDADRSEAEEEPGAGCARAVASEDDGVVVARYPEWDRTAGLERPDWTTVREIEPALGPVHQIEEAMARDPGLIARIDRLVRAARVGRATRLKRQPEGLELDLDAAIDAAKALRTGEIPDERIHLRKVMRFRDLAVIVLIDTSELTRDPVAAGRSVLDVEKHAVAALAHAMGSLGDAFALMAFASVGREDVRVARVKDFSRPFGRFAISRLAGLSPGYSTRLGAALRHAGAELRLASASRRLILVLTDGAPSDIDVVDPLDLVDDARRAVLSLKARGIDTFGLTLDPNGEGAGAAVFGRSNHLPVRRIEDLPRRLSELYFRIACR